MGLVVVTMLSNSIPPRVEDPWPDSIGLELPIAMSGTLGILAGVLFSGASEARRDRAIRRGGVLGFLLGTVIYLASLAAQLCSGR